MPQRLVRMDPQDLCMLLFKNHKMGMHNFEPYLKDQNGWYSWRFIILNHTTCNCVWIHTHWDMAQKERPILWLQNGVPQKWFPRQLGSTDRSGPHQFFHRSFISIEFRGISRDRKVWKHLSRLKMMFTSWFPACRLFHTFPSYVGV